MTPPNLQKILVTQDTAALELLGMNRILELNHPLLIMTTIYLILILTMKKLLIYGMHMILVLNTFLMRQIPMETIKTVMLIG